MDYRYRYDAVENIINHNWHRDYNPNLGRYIQSEPIGLEGGVNVYGYANASPIILIDPNGESAFCYFKWILIDGLGGAATGCAFGAAAGAGLDLSSLESGHSRWSHRMWCRSGKGNA